MKKMSMVVDNYYLSTTDKDEMAKTVKDFTDGQTWWAVDEKLSAADPNMPVPRKPEFKFYGLPAEPIMAPALLTKKYRQRDPRTGAQFGPELSMTSDTSAEAVIDTMNDGIKTTNDVEGFEGTGLLMAIGAGQVMPVGRSAITGLNSQFRVSAAAETPLRKYDPDALAYVYWLMGQALGDYGCTVMTSFGKVRAVNSARYAPIGEETVWNLCWESMKTYPKAEFMEGYLSHEFTQWAIDLSAYCTELYGPYAKAISAQYKPVLVVSTSNTLDSAVRLKPGLKVGNYFVPLTREEFHRHTAAGDFEERTKLLSDYVAKAFEDVVPQFEHSAGDINALKKVPIQYAYDTFLRAMSAVQFPWNEAAVEAEILRDMFAQDFRGKQIYVGVTALDLFACAMDAYALVAAAKGYTPRQKIAAADAAGRLVNIDWNKLDTAEPFQRPQKELQKAAGVKPVAFNP